MKKKNWKIIVLGAAVPILIKLFENGIPTIAPLNSAIIPQNNSVPQSEIWTVKPGSIYDGDTLRVVRGSEELKIRFCGIDAPEKKQAMGIESRDHLRDLVAQGSGPVAVIPVETDRHGRTVAELFVLGDNESEIHLNSQMVADGMAYHYEQYSDNCPNRDAIIEAERLAKEADLGVWANPNRQYPWEFRKN